MILLVFNKRETKGLQDYGLIIDVMIKGAQFISAPNSWTGDDSKSIGQRMGMTLELCLLKQIVLNKDGGWHPFWNNPLPPIIFITTLTEDDEVLQRILDIKQAWRKQMGGNTEDAKIVWWRKWDLDVDQYIKLMKEW